ncbi:DUF5343 domain-containing protein [Janibacter melonis]|uniref:DUF5343 domain-containing protein n=1 Tax=Janibacter melonis TaxID=262209 RepID=UPI00191A7233|nr:DUF5343 domain-containing protein [Janibacter melonis]
MTVSLPYIATPTSIKKTLDKVIDAQTPSKFTQEFLSTKLGLGDSGAVRPVIPFLKKTGFIASDGTPTPLYNRFRNESTRGLAAAEAVRHGYKSLYEINEYVHDMNDQDLKGVVIQATGAQENSSTVTKVIASFKALKSYADFNATDLTTPVADAPKTTVENGEAGPRGQMPSGLNLGYTINLNLPATADIAVFDAIFKSLRNHILD